MKSNEELVSEDLADYWQLADDGRPGEVLYPGEEMIVNRGNNPLQKGETITVWVEYFYAGHGSIEVCAELAVIGDDEDGDVFAVPADEDPDDVSAVFRVVADLQHVEVGDVQYIPTYDGDGQLEVKRRVRTRGNAQHRLLEARRNGSSAEWF